MDDRERLDLATDPAVALQVEQDRPERLAVVDAGDLGQHCQRHRAAGVAVQQRIQYPRRGSGSAALMARRAPIGVGTG